MKARLRSEVFFRRPLLWRPLRSDSARQSRASMGSCYNSCYTTRKTALRMISGGPFNLVAGAGFEPATSGL
jgi:hypothetical protein